jgi:hypothetical protein
MINVSLNNSANVSFHNVVDANLESQLGSGTDNLPPFNYQFYSSPGN